MSESFFDDLARTLARPMPRRRAVRLLGVGLVTAAVPGVWSHAASAQGCEGRCTGSRQSLCGEPKGTGCLHTCCNDLRPVCCKWPERETYICCGKGERCGEKAGECIPACPTGQVECKGKCCKPGELCNNGACCPNRRVCGSSCCPPGHTCTWSGKKRKCCPDKRVVVKKGIRYCCLLGTVAVERRSACCPALDRNCCYEDLAPLTGPDPYDNPRTFCVRGKAVKL